MTSQSDPGFELDAVLDDEQAFGINSAQVWIFLEELRELDLDRAVGVWDGYAAARARGYAEALESAERVAGKQRPEAWGRARRATSIVARHWLTDAAVAGEVVAVLADVAGAIVVRDLLSRRDFHVLQLPWTWRGDGAAGLAPIEEAEAAASVAGAEAEAAGSVAGGEPFAPAPVVIPEAVEPVVALAARPPMPLAPIEAGWTAPVGVAAAASETPAFVAAAQASEAAALVVATPASTATPRGAPTPAAASATPASLVIPLAATRARSGTLGRALGRGAGRLASNGFVRTAARAATIIATVTVLAVITRATPYFGSDAPTDTPFPSYGAMSAPSPFGSALAVAPSASSAAPTSTSTPTTAPVGGPTTPAPTPGPGRTPGPTPRPTPRPTPTPTPKTMCTVVDLVGSNTAQAQQKWNLAGFTGTVTFSPDVPPQFKILSQNLAAGSSILCTSGITVSATTP